MGFETFLWILGAWVGGLCIGEAINWLNKRPTTQPPEDGDEG